jgi:hypothetical protein
MKKKMDKDVTWVELVWIELGEEGDELRRKARVESLTH